MKILRVEVGVIRVEAAGSLRRGRDTVGDLDLLVLASEDAAGRVVEAFTKSPGVEAVLERGSTRARVVLRGALNADLRVLDAESFGAAWLYFTGSKDHNIALRALALRKGWTLNEYALTRKKDGRRIAGATEEEVYKKLGLARVPPELRENRGEIEQAAAGELPHLLSAADIKGDLHTHTSESDGHAPLEDMVDAAKALGRNWMGISDHSQGLAIARGLDAQRYARQRRAIDRLQRSNRSFRILQGAEVDIRKDGRLDLEAAARAQLDYVIGSVHSSFRLPKAEQTDRVVRAVEGGIDVLGHPSGRLLGTRDPIDLDWERVFEACARTGVALEINASHHRLDLAGERVRAARGVGASFAIDTDAHSTGGLAVVELGVVQARRGGLEARDVWTTLTSQKLMAKLGHSRRA